MKSSFKLIVMFMIAVLIGCAGEKARPEEQDAAAFNDQAYLTAEASGATEGEAKRSAMAALASIFQSRVQAETLNKASSYLSTDGNEQFEKQVEQMVLIETDVRLEGAQIGWVKPVEELGGYRALAVLNKREAADRWRAELMQIQTDIEASLSALNSVKGRLPRLIMLNRLAILTGKMAEIEPQPLGGHQ